MVLQAKGALFLHPYMEDNFLPTLTPTGKGYYLEEQPSSDARTV
jgi:hypothetical protein